MYSNDMLEIAMNESFGYEPVNEGFLAKLMSLFKKKDQKQPDKKCTRYDMSSTRSESVGSVKKNCCSVLGSKKEAILLYIKNPCQCNIDMEKLTISSSNNKKLEKILDNKVYLYTYEVTNKKKDSTCDSRKVVEIEEGTLAELMKKYGIKFEISEETNKFEQQRIKIYKDAISISKGYINKLKSDYPNITKGFAVTDFFSDDEYDDLSEFVNGINDYICIVDCTAWGYTDNKARTEYEEYAKCFDSLIDLLIKDNILAKYGTIDYYGDWDDGPICLIVNG